MSEKGRNFSSSARYQSTGSRDPIWTRVSGDPANQGSEDSTRATDEKVSAFLKSFMFIRYCVKFENKLTRLEFGDLSSFSLMPRMFLQKLLQIVPLTLKGAFAWLLLSRCCCFVNKYFLSSSAVCFSRSSLYILRYRNCSFFFFGLVLQV